MCWSKIDYQVHDGRFVYKLFACLIFWFVAINLFSHLNFTAILVAPDWWSVAICYLGLYWAFKLFYTKYIVTGKFCKLELNFTCILTVCIFVKKNSKHTNSTVIGSKEVLGIPEYQPFDWQVYICSAADLEKGLLSVRPAGRFDIRASIWDAPSWAHCHWKG